MKSFNIESIVGLSEKDVALNQKQEGYNELPTTKKRSVFAIAGKILTEPMFLLLIVGGVLYFILGDIHESLILLFFVFFIMGITLYQENKTERALEALHNLSSPRALVIRDGKEKRIAGRDVVREDIIVVHEGDYVPADASILFSNNLLIDESLLTGESVPVSKSASEDFNMAHKPGGDNSSNIYASTLVVQGYGVAKVYGISINTEIGKIGKALQNIGQEQTPLQKMTGKLVKSFALVGLSVCVFISIYYGMTRGSYLNGILAGITLAMAIIPEEIPVILTTFLALGAWRISKKNVLTRRVPAVESLGSATVLCVDKTGTLTMNEMQVQAIFAQDKYLSCGNLPPSLLDENYYSLMQFSALASQRDPFDPMEKAIKNFSEKYLPEKKQIPKSWQLVHQYPLSREILAISHVWQAETDKDYLIAAKGAPEAIIDLCHLDKNRSEKVLTQVKKMAQDGLRVLGVAKATIFAADLPKNQHEYDFEFIGLIGLADPIRPTVKDSVKKCYSAGIKVVMITGDYPETALNIAKQIDLKNAGKIITGCDLQRMSDIELQQQIAEVSVFARIAPEQKLRIVNAFRENGEIVAMTGDGVNDAPALKAAHIGVAMGKRGTDVAREAADLVLLDDDFSSIVQAINLGRRVFDNIKKAIVYTLAVHVPIIGMSLLPVIFKWPLVLLPVHIAFLQLIIDPVCSIVFEAEEAEANTMNRPPRNPNETLFNWQTLKTSLIQGGISLLITVVVFLFATYLGFDENKIRTLTFTTLLLTNLGLIFSNRSWTKNIFQNFKTHNPALWWIVGLTVFFLGIVLYVPFLQKLFSFSVLSPMNLFACLIAGIIGIVCFELAIFFIKPSFPASGSNS
jgi:Ca2+-transporting ATPase